jgi:hypothetical protein
MAAACRPARHYPRASPTRGKAVRAGATLGEICDDLRGVFGVYEPQTA